MEPTQLLVAREVAKSFPTPEGSLQILNDVSLELNSGEAVAITGPSGCGKSTFLSILGALDVPTSGSVTVDGVQLESMSEKERSTFRNQTVGFVFQDHHLLPQCTVIENVVLPTLAMGRTSSEDLQYAESLLERVGLSERRDHTPGRLSGGERQRTALCRALINRPKLLLADEPTGNLDPKTADAVGELLLGIGAEFNAALVCVTHSMPLAEQFPRHVRLLDGRIQ